jgi:hypothetical protein
MLRALTVAGGRGEMRERYTEVGIRLAQWACGQRHVRLGDCPSTLDAGLKATVACGCDRSDVVTLLVCVQARDGGRPPLFFLTSPPERLSQGFDELLPGLQRTWREAAADCETEQRRRILLYFKRP